MRKKLFYFFALVLAFTFAISHVAENNMTVQTAIYSFGAKGDTVRTIQDKLKRWGYYSGSVDGMYGSRTMQAVKSFQRKNGLKQDGIVGKKTLEALGIFESTLVSSNTSATAGSRESDVWLLASVINGEARGESYLGQVAVGAVVLNRVKHPSFPNTIAGVIYQQGAFDAVSDGQINLQPTDSCLNAARDALNDWDPTNGAIYYWNPKTATNKWVLSIPVTISIDNHNFGKR